MSEETKQGVRVVALQVKSMNHVAVEGAIRDLEMMVSHYERQRNWHLSQAVTRDMVKRAEHLKAVELCDLFVEDLQRRIVQLKKALNME